MRFYDFDKTAARREFQKRNYVFFGLFFGAFVVIPALSYVLVKRFGIESAPPFIVMTWMLAWVAAGIWRTSWKCPRCHELFFHKWWYGDGFITRCLHCYLRPDQLIEDFIPKER